MGDRVVDPANVVELAKAVDVNGQKSGCMDMGKIEVNEKGTDENE